MEHREVHSERSSSRVNKSIPKYPLLAFDFDGVISNSIHDSFRTALNAYIHVFPGNRLNLSQPVDPPEQIYAFEKMHPGLYEPFRQLIPFGNRAEDYCVLLRIIEENKTGHVNDQDSYNTYKNRLSAQLLEHYQNVFYSLRKSYQEDSPERWSELLPVFPGIVSAIQHLSGRFKLAISSSKDKDSIHIQLKSYGLGTTFSRDYIMDKDVSPVKKHHLEILRKQHDIPFDQIHFIDDKVLHLVDVVDLGVNCYLASWGFNTKREHETARQNGFRILEIKDLPSIGL